VQGRTVKRRDGDGWRQMLYIHLKFVCCSCLCWLSILAINDEMIGQKERKAVVHRIKYQAAYLASYLSFACSC
jgi:hypothetical protein